MRQGHDVTLFASGDSVTSAQLVAGSPQSLRLWPGSVDALAHHIGMLERVASLADAFDIIHFHIDYLHFPLSRRMPWRHVTTLHGRLDLPDLQPLYDEFFDMPVVSISNDQRRPLPQAAGRPRSITGCRLSSTRRASADDPTWRSSAASRPRNAWTGPSRSRGGPACRCGSPPRSTRSIAPTSSATSSRSSSSRAWTTSAKSARTRRTSCSAGRPRCSSRSTGPSRSGS